MLMDINHDTHNYPMLTVFFTALSWIIAAVDFVALDQSIFEPAAHIAAFASGTVAVVLGCLSIREKLKNK